MIGLCISKLEVHAGAYAIVTWARKVDTVCTFMLVCMWLLVDLWSSAIDCLMFDKLMLMSYIIYGASTSNYKNLDYKVTYHLGS